MTIRILIVDDHALMREGLRALLVQAGDMEVVGEASDGRLAVAEVMKLTPDVVLMDISMPGLNGTEALRAMRKRHLGARVVMLSMHSSSEHVFRAMDAGADGYLLKDTAGKELLAAVRSVHSGRRYVSSAVSEQFANAGARQQSPVDRLSARERQVLQLVVEGKSSNEIAETVHLSPKSVGTYRSRLMKKLEVPDVAALVKFALQHGITI